MVEIMSFYFEVALLIHQLAEMLIDRGSVECWFGIGVALEAKKFVAVKRNDEITSFVGLNRLDCLADDVTFSFKVGAAAVLARNIDAILSGCFQDLLCFSTRGSIVKNVDQFWGGDAEMMVNPCTQQRALIFLHQDNR